jgi:Tol biopolymer transport system component
VRGSKASIMAVAVVAIAVLVGTSIADAETVELISVNTEGEYADGASHASDISADGRYVAFESSATDVVESAGYDNEVGDIYVRDRLLGETYLVSVGLDGLGPSLLPVDGGDEVTPADGASAKPSISPDGRYVAFQSDATNLVAGDTNGYQDVFVRDLVDEIIVRMSVRSDGTQGNGQSSRASVTCDEERVYVAYQSTASNLIAEDTNGDTKDVFVSYYWKADPFVVITELISRKTNGNQKNGGSGDPSISGDGTYVAYESNARLDGHDTDDNTDIYVTDWDKDGTGSFSTQMVSVKTGGQETVGQDCLNPSISDDGNFVAYDSTAIHLVTPYDEYLYSDVFVTDWNQAERADMVTVKASVGDDGPEASGGNSEFASISGDGRYVAFESDAYDLVADDENGKRDVFVRDLWTDTTYLMSTDFFGNQGNRNSGDENADSGPAITPSYGDEVPQVSFFSKATDLTYLLDGLEDTNEAKDVFVGTTDTTPTITEIKPAKGSTFGGELVFIYGTNFVGLGGFNPTALGAELALLFPGVTFGGVEALGFFPFSTMMIMAASPAHEAGTVQVQVNAAGGPTEDTEADDYTYVVPQEEVVKVTGRTRHEQSEAMMEYSGEWQNGEGDSLWKGQSTYSTDPKAKITITFTGTQLDWIATLGPLMGKALVSIDGGTPVLVDLFSATELFQQVAWSTGPLAYGKHVITITFPEGADYVAGKAINIDAVDIYNVFLKTEPQAGVS